MLIKLPDFKDTQCVWVRACGQIETEDPYLIEILGKKNTYIASYEAHGKKAFLRVLTGRLTKQHLHIDCALSTIFNKNHQPKTTNEVDDVISIVSNFIGKKISIGVMGTFELSLNELPEYGLLRSLSTEERTGDISIKLVGGDFEITGAPIQHVKWQIEDDVNRVKISIDGEKSETIDERYLLNIFEWIEIQYNLFVKGQTKNDSI